MATFVGHVNRHDVDACVAMLAPDFEFRDEAGTFSIGRSDAGSMLGWDAALGASARIEVLHLDTNAVNVRLTETNRFLELAGISQISHRVRYEIDGATISGIVLLEAQVVAARVATALEPVLQWAARERAAELADLTVNSVPVYTADSAPRWLALLGEAQAAGVLRQ